MSDPTTESVHHIDSKVIKQWQSNFSLYQDTKTFTELLDVLALQIRETIGAHQSAVGFVPCGNFSKGASYSISLGDKYAKYRAYDVLPTGKGIWALLFETGGPIRLTEAELRVHPRFKNFSNLKTKSGLEHPPMPGLLAVTIKRKNGKVIGVLMLSDKYDGDFTRSDQMVLENFAALVAGTFEVEDSNEQLVRANAELIEQRKELERVNEELNQFTFIASHDLQSPLKSIIGFSDLLMRELKESNQKAQDHLSRIGGAARRMNQLIHDLLNYSRLSSSEHVFERVDLHSVYDTVLANLEDVINKSHAKITTDKLPVIIGVKTQLVQLFQNLIGNAIKYCVEGVVPELTIHVRAQEGRYEITFHDNGIGIESEYSDRIFEPFRRLHTSSAYEGTGVGLSICKKIVGHHGGSIVLQNKEPPGSTFIVTLPEHQAS